MESVMGVFCCLLGLKSLKILVRFHVTQSYRWYRCTDDPPDLCLFTPSVRPDSGHLTESRDESEAEIKLSKARTREI